MGKLNNIQNGKTPLPFDLLEINSMPLELINAKISLLEFSNCDSYGKEQLKKDPYYQALIERQNFLNGKIVYSDIIYKQKRRQSLLNAKTKLNAHDPFEARKYVSTDPTLDNK